MSSPSRSGAFDQAVDRRVEKFSESISFDWAFYRQDIRGSLAHASMLAKQGLISEDECRQISQGLKSILDEIETGTFVFQEHLEDIHMNIEHVLIERLGDVGRKLHTARSRNDQVATDLRLWVRDQIDQLDQQLLELQKAFVGRCEPDADVVLPAYTHMRRAQPVLAAHYWLAYCEKLERDRGRLADCRRRTNVSSLGAAAVAGTTLPIDREYTARELGFDSVAMNSLDISSDRDFVLEFVFALSVIGVHLSGWAEEWILWSTTEFDFIDLPHAFCTGSSIMPQKINPDVLELTRGKSARVIGALQTLLVLTKGLPLAYNRDLQEDKPPMLDAARTIAACLDVAIPIVQQTRLKVASIRRRLEEGYLDATTLMEFLIKQGIPQRTAHHFVGELVRKAAKTERKLADLPLEEFQRISPNLDRSVYDGLGVDGAIQSFVSAGSTAPELVLGQIAAWKNRLKI